MDVKFIKTPCFITKTFFISYIYKYTYVYLSMAAYNMKFLDLLFHIKFQKEPTCDGRKPVGRYRYRWRDEVKN